MRTGKTLPFFLLAMLAGPVHADPPVFENGPERALVIELFTSEGCNSCPPAEEHLNGYVDKPGLWTRYIPLAFHVDYWDYLGWRDPYADPRHGQRQRRYAGLKRATTVYTPAFFVNGEAWSPRWFGRSLPAITDQIGTLTVRLDDGIVSAGFEPTVQQTGPFELHVAVLGMGLESAIRAGENRGRQARHEFVVLGQATATNEGNEWRLPLPPYAIPAPRHALVAWVSRRDDPTPLQAAGGYLP